MYKIDYLEVSKLIVRRLVILICAVLFYINEDFSLSEDVCE